MAIDPTMEVVAARNVRRVTVRSFEDMADII